MTDRNYFCSATSNVARNFTSEKQFLEHLTGELVVRNKSVL